EVPLNITGEVRDDVNVNFFDCKDVTGDGYNDIVSYSYSNTGLPHVYANNKNNSFTYIGQKMFPNTYTEEYGKIYSTTLHDFDKDGFMDLVFWPANGITTTGNLKFRFYRGQRKLI
ncbi:VCBS repeat-containing protein, partial [bacterium]|nr:VCBS repeat-containing protein [Candidatus Elulimicrobium humile]